MSDHRTPRWILIATGVIGHTAALFLAAARYFEFRKAKAEAEVAETVRQQSDLQTPSREPGSSPSRDKASEPLPLNPEKETGLKMESPLHVWVFDVTEKGFGDLVVNTIPPEFRNTQGVRAPGKRVGFMFGISRGADKHKEIREGKTVEEVVAAAKVTPADADGVRVIIYPSGEWDEPEKRVYDGLFQAGVPAANIRRATR